ncbi:MAG: hypothetical protein V3S83_01530 [Gemmatimonadota bacterium]
MSRVRAITLLAIATLALGCDDDDVTGPQSSINDGGIGNQSLLVVANVGVIDINGGFLTGFSVDVSDREGEPVSGADVVIEGGFGPRTLSEGPTPGSYLGELSGAAWGTLRLDVERDTLFVHGIVLGNIGIHTFTAPQPEDTVEAQTPLVVRWFRDSEAPMARLSTRDVTLNDVPDTGEFILPDSLNPARSNQRFELVRSNEVQIAGGLRGSFFRLEVRNAIEQVVVD